MPREQFFLDEQEDTIHNNQIELKTAKDKRANWWYYHKFHVLGVIVAIALIATLVYSFVSKVSPDYAIGLITQQDYSSDVVEKLEQELKAYADDRNGDGQVVVQVNSYSVNQADVQMQQANVVRLIGDATSFDTVLYLSDLDSFEWLQEQNDIFFAYTDGTTPEEGATDFENMRVNWADCKALSNMDLSIDMLNAEQAQKYMEPLALSLRVIDGTQFINDEKNVKYYQDCQALMERLISGEKVENNEK